MNQDAVRIAAVTLNPKYGDVEANKNAIIEWLEQAASRSAKLVVFPEGILSGYDLNRKEQVALSADDDAIEDIAHYAEVLDTVASVGFIERDGDNYYVSQIFLGNGIRQVYRKCHLTGWEKEHCRAGDQLEVQDCGLFKTGTLICYDSAFPAAAETLVRRGAQVLLTPTSNGIWMNDLEAQGGQEAVIEARRQHVHCYWRARAFDYSVYALYVEPVGVCSNGEYHPGYAAIFGPDGQCLIERRNGREGMISCSILPQDLTQCRQNGVGHYKTLGDVRPELYDCS